MYRACTEGNVCTDGNEQSSGDVCSCREIICRPIINAKKHIFGCYEMQLQINISIIIYQQRSFDYRSPVLQRDVGLIYVRH